jgi:hypothetical protein
VIAILWVTACGDDPTRGSIGDTSPPPNDTDAPPVDTETADTDTISGGALVEEVDAYQNPNIGSIAVVSWNQTATADAHVEFSFDPDVWVSSPVVTRAAGPQEELLLGVPYDRDITWRLVVTDGTTTFTSEDAVFHNGPLPTLAPVLQVTVADPTRFDAAGAPYFLVGLPQMGENWSGAPWWEIIIDRQGRVVWALRSPINRSFMHARVARDGTSLLLDHNSAWPAFDNGAASSIERTAIDGTVLHVYATPGLHHPFTDLPDGSIAYGASTLGGEHIVVVHDDGTTEDLFDCDAWVDTVAPGDFCSSNTLTYDEPTNKFLFSHYSIGTIIEVDRSTGLVDRWWGGAASPWVFAPVDSEFTWQHGGHITENGTLLTSTDTVDGTDETVAREYALDDTTRTLTEVASWDVGENLLAGVMGEAFFLPNGNLVHNLGALARLREFAADDGAVVWDVHWPNDAIGRTMPIVDLYALKAP